MKKSELAAEVAALREEVSALRAEIARLRSLPVVINPTPAYPGIGPLWCGPLGPAGPAPLRSVININTTKPMDAEALAAFVVEGMRRAA